jgi:CBS-domain-containing membrane protein
MSVQIFEKHDCSLIAAKKCLRGNMITVKDIMTTDVISVKLDTEILEAARILLKKRFNGLPVVDDIGKVVGIICQSDLVAQEKSLPIPTLFTFLDGFIPLTSVKKMESEIQKIAAITVRDAMTKNPVTVKTNTRIETVAALMADKKFHTLPVLDDDGILVGIIGKEDLLRTIIKKSSSTGE